MMRQTLGLIIVPLVSSLFLFSPKETIEFPQEKEIDIAEVPTTEEIIKTTDLYKEVQEVEKGIDDLHAEIEKLKEDEKAD